MVRVLCDLDAGVIRATNKEGFTACCVAAQNGYLEVLRVLMLGDKTWQLKHANKFGQRAFSMQLMPAMRRWCNSCASWVLK